MIRKRKVIICSAEILFLALVVFLFVNDLKIGDILLFQADLSGDKESHLYYYFGQISYPVYIFLTIYSVKAWRYFCKGLSWDRTEKNKIITETVILGFVFALIVIFWFLYKKTEYLSYCCTIPMTAIYTAAVASLLPHSKWYKVGYDYFRS